MEKIEIINQKGLVVDNFQLSSSFWQTPISS